MPGRLAELGPWLARPVAVICRTHRRSTRAARILARPGFAEVQVVRGGMTAWLERGWPVTKAQPKTE